MFSYENQGINNYYVYQLQENESVDQLTIGMLTNNQIPGFAKMLYSQVDTVRMVRYNITSKVTLRNYMSAMLNRHKTIKVFTGILDALTHA